VPYLLKRECCSAPCHPNRKRAEAGLMSLRARNRFSETALLIDRGTGYGLTHRHGKDHHHTLMAKMRRASRSTQVFAAHMNFIARGSLADRLGNGISCALSDTGRPDAYSPQSTVSVSPSTKSCMMSKANRPGAPSMPSPWSTAVLGSFPTFFAEPSRANAGPVFVHEGQCRSDESEVNKHHAKNIDARIVSRAFLLQGHIGITPMRMPQLWGLCAQGRPPKAAKEMVRIMPKRWSMCCFSDPV